MMLKIEILGSVCSSGNQLLHDIRELIQQNKLEATVSLDDQFLRMASLGISTGPALLINDILVSSGTSYTLPELRDLLSKYSTNHRPILSAGSRCSGQA